MLSEMLVGYRLRQSERESFSSVSALPHPKGIFGSIVSRGKGERVGVEGGALTPDEPSGVRAGASAHLPSECGSDLRHPFLPRESSTQDQPTARPMLTVEI